MRAKDVMEKVTATLSPEDTLETAVKRMEKATRREGWHGVKGMAVLSASGDLVGMLSIKDILRAIVPHYLKATSLGEFTWDGMLEETTRKVAHKKVGEIMSSGVISVPEDAPLMECAELLVTRNIQRLPVLDGKGRLAGMIYLRDLYYAITRALRSPGDEEAH